MRSGNDSVILRGPAMFGLVRAVEALGTADLGRYVVVGGVAVAARLGQAHRATTDVDTVVDMTTPPDAVEALLALPGATPDPDNAHRVQISGTKIEVLEVGPIHDRDLLDLPPDQALFVAAHAWALETATPLTVVGSDTSTLSVTAPFATPAALVAMKLHAIDDRAPTALHKRAADAFDMYRILLDLDGGGEVRTALRNAPARLRELVGQAAQRVLVDEAVRTRQWLHAGGGPMDSVTVDNLRYVGEALVQGLA